MDIKEIIKKEAFKIGGYVNNPRLKYVGFLPGGKS